ncbi:unnamed protein product [Staurois parvus]|uniref:Uncharacterized protein n=1 Tax=Staurois parvus TaxID=386267 RepID=A0ABN9EW04_9NEOB|nr:unnamed protein product [Staurois parvus]
MYTDHQGTADHRSTEKTRRCRLGHVISCVQSQLITWDIYTDHQGTDDQCALMIIVAPAVPPVSAHQCHLPVPISAFQCHLSVPVSATYQCQSVPHISAANQCHLSVPVSAAYQCSSVLPISAT